MAANRERWLQIRYARAVRIVPAVLLAVLACAVLQGARAAPGATFVVTATGDGADSNTADGVCDDGSGQCTLRAAIQQANAAPDADTIGFGIPGGGPHTIRPLASLPTISAPVVIDGTTEPDFVDCATGPALEVDGTSAGSGVNGLDVATAGSTIRGFVINRFGSGAGIRIHDNAGGNVVACNFIGTDTSGTLARPNQYGIEIDGSNGNTVGGTAAGAANLISGNSGNAGIHIFSNTGPANGNVVQGNLIGTAIDGSSPLGNAFYGVQIGFGASNNTIGGSAAGAGNVIAFNGGLGVAVGTGTSNRVLSNSSFSNVDLGFADARGLGIDLARDGVTANDSGDGDGGANNLQNYPALSSATSAGGTTTVNGTLNSATNTTYRIEFFASAACDGSGNGEGETFLGAEDVTTDGSGNAAFAAVLGSVQAGRAVTATATDPSGNTSEFSPCVTVASVDCSAASPTGAVKEAEPPANLRQDGLPAVAGRPLFESDECIFLFVERQDVTLTQTLQPAKPKTTNILATATPEQTTIPAGTVVDSYLLHADRPGQPTSGVTTLSGRWTFDQPIVGISIAHSGLTATDPMLGLSTITYEQNETGRGVETSAQSANFDDVHVDPADPRTIVVTFKFLQALDEIRVMTAAPGAIVVRKDAVPDDPDDFAFTAGGGLSPAQFSLDDDPDDGTLANERRFEGIAAMSGYSIAETVPAGWGQTSATCSDGSPVTNINVAPGETVTCTYVNTRTAEPCEPAPGTAVVGSSAPKDLRLGRTESDSCILLFGEREDVTLASPLTVDSSPTGSTVLPAGSVVSSYLLHQDKLGGSQASVTLQGSYTFPERVLGIISSTSRLESTDASLGTPGSCPPSPPASGLCYETNDAAGRGLELPADVADVQPDGHTVSFTMGTNTGLDNVRVLIGTLPEGTIVVRKDAVPDAADDFPFTVGGGLSPAAFSLDDDPGDVTLPNEQRFEGVPAGSGYSVSETVPEGWTLTSATCSDGSPVTNVSLAAGETVTCTFVNARLVEPCTPAPGNAIVASSPPRDLRANRTESNACILLFTEQQDVTLSQDINPKAPSTTSVLAGPNRRIRAGTVVDGYLLHADKVGSSTDVVRLIGRWTFAEPILGISVTRDGLLVGDGITGLDTLTYEPSDPDRGLEAAAPHNDFLRVDPNDPTTLEVDFSIAGAMDEIRVFTGVIPPPEPCDVEEPTNAIEQAYPPADLRLGGKESDRCIYFFEERQGVQLPQSINVKKPLSTNMLAGPNVTLPSGSVVDSFLLHADSPGAPGQTTVTLSGSWRFEDTILGVSVTKGGLVTGDGLTGLPDPGSLRYEKGSAARGLEGPGADTDLIWVDANDDHVLHVQFGFNVMDEIRVFTGTPPRDCEPPNPPNAVSPAAPDPQADLRLDRYESNTCLFLFDEQQNVQLTQDIRPTRPATTNMLAAGVRAVRIPAGSVVDSFLLHGDSLGPSTANSPVTLTGRVTFQEPIVGVSVTSAGLRAGDALTGLPDPDVVRYEQTSDARGVEGPGQDDDEVYVDADDPKTLHVTFHFNAMDEIRIYTGTLASGTVVVRKDAVPDHAQDFPFTADGGFEPEAFALDDDGDEGDTLASTVSDVVYAGAGYSVAENVPAGWDQTSASCDDGSPVANIDVSADETVTCTFTNTRHARIVVVKQTTPDGDPTEFDFSASYDADGFALADGQSNDSGRLEPGSYSVSEAPPPGWRQANATCSDGSAPTSIQLGVGEIVTCTFFNERIPPAGVSGVKFNDLDGDGTRAASGEAGLQDWVIRAYVDGNANGSLGVGENTLAAATQTASDGSYSLSLPPGSYVVCEVTQAQWEQTGPAPVDNECGDSVAGLEDGGHAVTLAAGATATGAFANRLRRAGVSGVKFDDADGDGARAASGETGLQNWVIRAYVDANADGTLDSGETTVAAATQTALDGSYSLTLAPGSYVVCEVEQAAWEQTAPTPTENECGDAVAGLGDGGYALALGPGQHVGGQAFGNRLRRAHVSGVKFDDVDGDGSRAPAGEPGLEHWMIRAYVDTNANGRLDPGEGTVAASAETAVNGSYQLALAPGSYVLCEVAHAQWEQTAPAPSDNECGDVISGLEDGGHAVTLAPADNVGGQDFANWLERARVSGAKFHDVDANGAQAPSGEPGLQNWVIRAYVDSNSNNQLDAGEGTVAAQAQTAGDGTYQLPLAPGRYVLCEVAQAGWTQTAPVPADNECGDAVSGVADGGHPVTLAPGATAGGLLFGNRIPTGTISGVKFDDVDGNGVHTVADEPLLQNWTIRAYVDTNANGILNAGETTLAAQALTAADGSYDLTVPPGSYVVCEVQQSSWQQTAPAPAGNQCGDTVPGLGDGGHAVTLTPGASAAGRSFGNRGHNVTITKTQQDCTPTPCGSPQDPLSVDFHDTLRYTVTVRNAGPGSARNVRVRDDVPAGVTVTNVTPPPGTTCVALAPNQRRCMIGTLSPGGQAQILFDANVTVVPAPCTIVGTSGNDPPSLVNGTAGADVICGLGGSDEVHAGAGNDVVWGDAPANLQMPGPLVNRAWLDTNANDAADPGEQQATATANVLRGTDLGDNLSGDAGNDGIAGQSGNDFIFGGTENDGGSGGIGNDTIAGGTGVDTLNGEDGDDIINGNDQRDVISGGNGGDFLYGDTSASSAAGNDSIGGDAGNDTIFGFGGPDGINGDAGVDTIDGGADDDSINGGDQSDVISGGAGSDAIGGDSPTSTAPGNDEINGGTGNDSINGYGAVDTIHGDAGADVVRGGDGGDHLFGDEGNDEMFGGDGNDVMAGESGADRMAGGSTTNLNEAGTGSDSLAGGSGDDLLLGQSGNDSLQGQQDNDRAHGSDGADQIDGGGPAVNGRDRNDGAINNILYGGDGNDDCSNGPLTSSIYAGTDRGDIRHSTCENPATGKSQRWTWSASQSRYVFSTFTWPSNTFSW